MIGFMFGTGVAFVVVIGDLAPPVIANLVNIEPTENLRVITLIGEE